MASQEIELFVPGRVCLFGEHSDWAGAYPNSEPGYTLVIGTDQGVYAKISPHKDRLIASSCMTRETLDIDFSVESLSGYIDEGFYRYVVATALEVKSRFDVLGLRIENFKMDLPLKKGLSSSAAICVLVVRGFSKIYNLNLSLLDEMDIAYKGERRTGSMCGRMDQACAYGKIPILMRFEGEEIDIHELSCPKPIYILLVDLKACKDTIKILSSLNDYYRTSKGHIGEGVRHYFKSINKAIVLTAKRAIEEGDAGKLGRLMTEAQRAFDDYLAPACIEELLAHKLHKVLAYEYIQGLIYGGKSVGSGGDGTAQIVIREKKDIVRVSKMLEALDVHTYLLTI